MLKLPDRPLKNMHGGYRMSRVDVLVRIASEKTRNTMLPKLEASLAV